MSRTQPPSRSPLELWHVAADVSRLARAAHAMEGVSPQRRARLAGLLHTVAASLYLEIAREGGADDMLACAEALAGQYLDRSGLADVLGDETLESLSQYLKN